MVSSLEQVSKFKLIMSSAVSSYRASTRQIDWLWRQPRGDNSRGGVGVYLHDTSDT